jgi:hypothetical protein
MKPLQIFEKHPNMDAYRVGAFFSPYCLLATEKRFSDAELAAEYQRARFMQYEEMLTIHRFASLPHFDA